MRHRSITLFCAALVAMVLMSSGCKDQGTNPFSPSPSPPAQTPTDTTPPGGGPIRAVSFSQDVAPLLSRYGCTGCHGGTNGLFVNTVAQLKQGGLHGVGVIPGNSLGSTLVQKISAFPPFGTRMPQGGPFMADSLILIISTWVDQGALDN